ncbi:Protein SERAC1 [Zalerion maritima]|uniref:Protein SERAC1 n=1 Tax=Zalerion maritima TaxID=339359 RepID=A0AAD5RQC3_9PEZI|nr:Protein SERAC1 [Zalerion maritima]
MFLNHNGEYGWLPCPKFVFHKEANCYRGLPRMQQAGTNTPLRVALPSIGSINRQIARFEISPVHTHPEAEVDIVLVHGLNGEPERTWTSSKTGVFWPIDLLPETLKDKPANILVYGYNADVYTSVLSTRHNTSTSSDFILGHAQTLVNTLAIYRKSERTSRNPIIWVAHSLGGILVKRALLYSNDVTADKHDYLRSIYVSTYGIIFLGTPHQGSQIANWGRMLQAMAEVAMPKKLYHSESVLLKTLKKDSETLQNISIHFLDIYQRFRIQMVREAQMTDLKGTRPQDWWTDGRAGFWKHIVCYQISVAHKGGAFVVEPTSAGPDLPEVTYYSIEATHSGMCKFQGKDAPGYRNVSSSIREWVEEAPRTIQPKMRTGSWLVLGRPNNKEVRGQFSASKRLNETPTGVADVETHDQSNKIEYQPPKLLHQGSSSLLEHEHAGRSASRNLNESFSSQVESEHGQGFPFVVPDGFRPNSFFKGREDEMKALHRVLMNKSRRLGGTASALIHGMPGSGKTCLAREYVFRHIRNFPGGIFWVRAKSLKEAEDAFWRIARHEAFRSCHSPEDIRDLRDQTKMVEIVKKWLNKREDWLMIVDGIHFTDEGMSQLIPFTVNTSLIYTSTERVIGDHRFNNPSLLDLPKLRALEAQELLLDEIGKKSPHTQDDLVRAMELVQLMENLPLMIHVAAQQITATGEPLSKYLRSYKKSPKVGSLPAYRAVLRQLRDRGQTEALNLMFILSFFSQEVPYELLAFGLRALDGATPVKSRDGFSYHASLNTTFKVLISFGLIERNVDDSPTSSQTSGTRSQDHATDGLDILKLHSVVQAFFIDTLPERDISFWLDRAIAVYCHSYDDADRRIKADPNAGLPEDYRFYRTHGEKLMSHLIKQEKKHAGIGRLASARQELETRYSTINSEIEDLTESLLNGEGAVVSIFRSPSISDSDMTTPASEADDGGPGYFPGGGGDAMPVASPISYERAHENVPQFHRPYPADDFYGEMPYMPSDHLTDDDVTVTPGLDSSVVLEGFDNSVLPGDNDDSRGWTTVAHRTIKRNSSRRYRDHAGAWRQTTDQVVDPRVSTNRPFTTISRYTAQGIVVPTVYGETQPGVKTHARHSSDTRSEAEETLAKINAKSPLGSEGGLSVQCKSRSSSATIPVRPSLAALGRTSYAQVASGVDQGPEEPPSATFGKILENAGNAASAALKKLGGAEGGSSTSPQGSQDVSSEASPTRNDQTTEENDKFVDNLVLQRRQIQASRSAQSSPAQRGVAWVAPPGLPVERYPGNGLHDGLGIIPRVRPKVHTQSPPPLGRDSTRSSGVSEDYHRMAQSVPAIPQTQVHPPPAAPNTPLHDREAAVDHWDALPPQGYSSQPMSRNASHQSANSDPGNSSRHTTGTSSGGSVGRSFPPPGSNRRSASVVESEPSPRLKALDVPLTSYDAYQDRVGGAVGGRRPRAGSESTTVRPSPLSLQQQESIFAGFNHKPSFIAASPDSGGRSGIGSCRASRDVSATSSAGSGSGRRSASRSMSRGRAAEVCGSGSGGEPLARSVSGGGGFAVKGRIIEFGEHPVDVQLAGERVRATNMERERRKQSPSSTRSSGNSGGCANYGNGRVVGGTDSGVGLGILKELRE